MRTTKNKYRLFILLATAMPMIALSSPARAQQDAASAEALFQKGVESMKAGLHIEACPILKDSVKLDPSPGKLYALADCYAILGQIASAVQRYDEYLREVAKLPADKRAKREQAGNVARAKAQIDTLKPQLPRVSFVLPPQAPEDTRVERDGIELSTASLSVPLPVDPGEHLVRVFVPGSSASETRFSIEKGETKSVGLTLNVAPAPKLIESPLGGRLAPPSGTGEKKEEAPPVPRRGGVGRPGIYASLEPEPGAEEMSKQRILTYAAVGVGAPVLIVGTVLGSIVAARSAELGTLCPRNKESGASQCSTEEDTRTFKQTQTMGAVATIALPAGGALLMGGALLWLLEPKAKAGEEKRGQVRMNVVSMGKTGAFMGVEGTW